jgi:hypothetical protein
MSGFTVHTLDYLIGRWILKVYEKWGNDVRIGNRALFGLFLGNGGNYIQGDSGGICITLGNDSMSDSKQKGSYEHGSDFERLRSYGHF